MLNDMELTSEELAQLGQLSHLRALVLFGTDVVDDDLIALRECDRLEYLNLVGTEVTDRCIDTILEMKSLQAVCLGDVRVTPAGIERLKERGGFVTADVVNITPETPNLEALLAKFSKEHTHSEDEVRFTVRGRGVFHIHPDKGPVFSVTVTRALIIRSAPEAYLTRTGPEGRFISFSFMMPSRRATSW